MVPKCLVSEVSWVRSVLTPWRRRCIHMFQILSRSVKGFRSCEGAKMWVFHWLRQSPYRATCDLTSQPASSNTGNNIIICMENEPSVRNLLWLEHELELCGVFSERVSSSTPLFWYLGHLWPFDALTSPNRGVMLPNSVAFCTVYVKVVEDTSIDFLQRKCRPKNAVFSDILFIAIFVGYLLLTYLLLVNVGL